VWSAKFVDGRACGLHVLRSSASWLNAQVYYMLVDCNPVTPLLGFVLDLFSSCSYTVVQQLARFWLTRCGTIVSCYMYNAICSFYCWFTHFFVEAKPFSISTAAVIISVHHFVLPVCLFWSCFDFSRHMILVHIIQFLISLCLQLSVYTGSCWVMFVSYCFYGNWESYLFFHLFFSAIRLG